jgi:hypothetical protein
MTNRYLVRGDIPNLANRIVVRVWAKNKKEALFKGRKEIVNLVDNQHANNFSARTAKKGKHYKGF